LTALLAFKHAKFALYLTGGGADTQLRNWQCAPQKVNLQKQDIRKVFSVDVCIAGFFGAVS
jgi:hypothetical protein